MRFLALHLHMKACPLPCLKYNPCIFFPDVIFYHSDKGRSSVKGGTTICLSAPNC